MQTTLKGNGSWRADWFITWNALTTPMHNVVALAGVNVGLASAQDTKLYGGTPLAQL